MFDILNIMSETSHIFGAMSHRERIAWLSLGSIAVTFGPYLSWMAIAPPTEPLPDLGTMRLFAAAAICQVLILGTGFAVLRALFPEEAAAPADERDRSIALRAIKFAYYTLMVGMILVGCVMPFNAGGWKIINAAIAVIVLAQVVHYGVAVWSYKRGQHA